MQYCAKCQYWLIGRPALSVCSSVVPSVRPSEQQVIVTSIYLTAWPTIPTDVIFH